MTAYFRQTKAVISLCTLWVIGDNQSVHYSERNHKYKQNRATNIRSFMVESIWCRLLYGRLPFSICWPVHGEVKRKEGCGDDRLWNYYNRDHYLHIANSFNDSVVEAIGVSYRDPWFSIQTQIKTHPSRTGIPLGWVINIYYWKATVRAVCIFLLTL